MTVDYLSLLISNKIVFQSYNWKAKGKRTSGISMVFSFILEINMVQVIPMEVIQNWNILQGKCVKIGNYLL